MVGFRNLNLKYKQLKILYLLLFPHTSHVSLMHRIHVRWKIWNIKGRIEKATGDGVSIKSPWRESNGKPQNYHPLVFSWLSMLSEIMAWSRLRPLGLTPRQGRKDMCNRSHLSAIQLLLAKLIQRITPWKVSDSLELFLQPIRKDIEINFRDIERWNIESTMAS